MGGFVDRLLSFGGGHIERALLVSRVEWILQENGLCSWPCLCSAQATLLSLLYPEIKKGIIQSLGLRAVDHEASDCRRGFNASYFKSDESTKPWAMKFMVAEKCNTRREYLPT